MRRQQVRTGRQSNVRALNYQPDNFVSTTNVVQNVKIVVLLNFPKKLKGFVV